MGMQRDHIDSRKKVSRDRKGAEMEGALKEVRLTLALLI